MTSGEAAATLNIAEVDVDNYVFSNAVQLAHVEKSDASVVKSSPEEEILSFDRWANFVVNDIGTHQMASVLAERHGIMADYNKRSELHEGSMTTTLSGSVFDSTSIAMEHSGQLFSNSLNPRRENSEFDRDSEVNIRRSQSQGKVPGLPSAAKQDMMLTLPPLLPGGKKYSKESAHSLMIRRKRGINAESTFSNRKLQSVAGFDQSFGRETPRCLRDSSKQGSGNINRAGSMNAIDDLRRELRITEEGLSRLNNIVEDNITWVQTHCDIGGTVDLSSRAKNKCRKISIEKFAEVLGNSVFMRIEKAFKRWRMLFHFVDLMAVVRSYSKIKSMQLFASAIGKVMYRIRNKVFTKWVHMVQMMQRFEQEVGAVEIQRIVRSRLGKNRCKERRAEIEFERLNSAAGNIQRVARGKIGRKAYMMKWKERKRHWAIYYLQHWFKTRILIAQSKEIANKRRTNRDAVINIQKIARGKQGRQRFNAVKAEKEYRRRHDESSSKLANFLRRNNETKSERNLLKQKKEEKKKNMFQQGLSAVSNAFSGKSGKHNPSDNDNDIDKHNFGADVDDAAVKLQAVARGRVARQRSMRLKDEKNMIKEPPQQDKVDEAQMVETQNHESAELDAAALKLQAVSRGRLARKKSERMKSEQKKTGMGIFRRKRGDEEADESSKGSEKSGKLFSKKLFGRNTTPDSTANQRDLSPKLLKNRVALDSRSTSPKPRTPSTPSSLPDSEKLCDRPASNRRKVNEAKSEQNIAKAPAKTNVKSGSSQSTSNSNTEPAEKQSSRQSTLPKSKDKPGSSQSITRDSAKSKDRPNTGQNVSSTPSKPKSRPGSSQSTDDSAIKSKDRPNSGPGAKDTAKPPSAGSRPGRKASVSTVSERTKSSGAQKKVETSGAPKPGSATDKSTRDKQRKSSETVSTRPSAKSSENRKDRRSPSPVTGKSKTNKEESRPQSRDADSSLLRGEPSVDAVNNLTTSGESIVKPQPVNISESTKDISTTDKIEEPIGVSVMEAENKVELTTTEQVRGESVRGNEKIDDAVVDNSAELCVDGKEKRSDTAVIETAIISEKLLIQESDAEKPSENTQTDEDRANEVIEPPKEITIEKIEPSVDKPSIYRSMKLESQKETKVAESGFQKDTEIDKPELAGTMHIAEQEQHKISERPTQSDESSAAPIIEVTNTDDDLKVQSEIPDERVNTKSSSTKAVSDSVPTTTPLLTEPASSARASIPGTPSNVLRSAKHTLGKLGSSFKRAVSPLLSSRPSSRGGSMASLFYSDDDSTVASQRTNQISRAGSRSSLLNQDDKLALEDTKRMIEAQRRATEYLTWAVVVLQSTARRYVARKQHKSLQALKKVICVCLSTNI